MQFKQFNRTETGEDTGEKRDNNWGGVLEGAGRLHMLPTWGLMFARKKDCLSIVTGGKKEDLETNVGIGRFWR